MNKWIIDNILGMINHNYDINLIIEYLELLNNDKTNNIDFLKEIEALLWYFKKDNNNYKYLIEYINWKYIG